MATHRGISKSSNPPPFLRGRSLAFARSLHLLSKQLSAIPVRPPIAGFGRNAMPGRAVEQAQMGLGSRHDRRSRVVSPGRSRVQIPSFH